MAEVGLLVKPPTRRAAEEAVREVRRLRPQALLLNLPEDIEGLVVSLSRGELNYEEFLDASRAILPAPAEAWLKEHGPLLRELPSIGGAVDVHCYLDSESFRSSAQESVEVALLTLREAVREEVHVDEWVRVIERAAAVELDSVARSVDRILRFSCAYDRLLCLTGFEARRMRSMLKASEVACWVKYLGLPYHFTPIQILVRLHATGKIEKDLLSKLVREHLKFVREYLYRMSYLEAVERWSAEKMYWLPAGRVPTG